GVGAGRGIPGQGRAGRRGVCRERGAERRREISPSASRAGAATWAAGRRAPGWGVSRRGRDKQLDKRSRPPLILFFCGLILRGTPCRAYCKKPLSKSIERQSIVRLKERTSSSAL